MSLENTKDMELSDELLDSVAGGSHCPRPSGFSTSNSNALQQTNNANIVNQGGGFNVNTIVQTNLGVTVNV